MSPAEREQLIAMSPAGRISHYLKKKIAGTISTQKYEECIAYALSLPYTTAIEESGEVGTPVRQPSVEERGLGEGTTDGGNTDEPASQASFITALERCDKSVLPRCTNGTADRQTSKGNPKSQKEQILELLSDGEWHTNIEIMQKVYDVSQGGYCNYKARIDELRNEHHNIPNAEKVGGKVYRYRLVKKDGFAETIKNIASG